MTVPPLVELRGVTKRYGFLAALTGVSFDLREGEVFGYIGPNGAGKTTTLKILAGLIPAYEGEVLCRGAAVPRGRGVPHAMIGYLPQGPGFQSWRTVDSALRSLALLSGVSPAVVSERIPPLLERFAMTAARHKKVKQLSGGMTQKLGLMQALLHEPRLLILDEPLEGLDPESRNLLKDVIRERKRAGVTVLFSSHILGDVEDVADRIGILSGGRIVTTGTIPELIAQTGFPLDVEVELSRSPDGVTLFGAADLHEPGVEVAPGCFRVRARDGADPDAVVHSLVEETLRAGGRLRRIGAAQPNLDDLFARLVGRARAA